MNFEAHQGGADSEKLDAQLRVVRALIRVRRLEDEDLRRLRKWGRRRRKSDDEEISQLSDPRLLPGTAARWDRPYDLFAPTPLQSRPARPDGLHSIHFKMEPIPRLGVPTINGVPLREFRVALSERSTALDHARYIEREGAAEWHEPNHHSYIERSSAIEALAEEAGGEQVFGVAVFSNIHPNRDVRDAYWKAIEKKENEAWVTISFTDALSSDDLARLHADGVHPILAKYARKILEERQLQERVTARKEIGPLKVRPDVAGAIFLSFGEHVGFKSAEPQIHFEPGRGGRVQHRLVADLPANISPNERATIARELAAIPDEEGLKYTLVIHAPDRRNHPDNYHLHGVIHDRDGTYENGRWSFERVEYTRSGRTEKRYHSPKKSTKNPVLTQSPTVSGKAYSGKNFIPWLRKKYVEILNRSMERNNLERRYHPGRYSEMGNPWTPTEHLGGARVSLEQYGGRTAEGDVVAAAIWGDAEQDIERHIAAERLHLLKSIEKAEGLSRSIGNSGTTEQKEVDQLVSAYHQAVKTICESERHLLLFELLERKAKSRAVRVIKTCDVEISEWEPKKPSKPRERNLHAAAIRKGDAEAHVTMIDEQLQAHRAGIEDVARQAVAARSRLAGILADIDKALPLMGGGNEAETPDLAQAPASPSKTVAETHPAPASPENSVVSVDPAAPQMATKPSAATPSLLPSQGMAVQPNMKNAIGIGANALLEMIYKEKREIIRGNAPNFFSARGLSVVQNAILNKGLKNETLRHRIVEIENIQFDEKRRLEALLSSCISDQSVLKFTSHGPVLNGRTPTEQRFLDAYGASAKIKPLLDQERQRRDTLAADAPLSAPQAEPRLEVVHPEPLPVPSLAEQFQTEIGGRADPSLLEELAGKIAEDPVQKAELIEAGDFYAAALEQHRPGVSGATAAAFGASRGR